MIQSTFVELAKKKILELYGTSEGEFGPTLFVEHHLRELDAEYWNTNFSSATPEPAEILKSLELLDAWNSGEDESITTYDFTLPKDVTNYVVSVRFKDGVPTEVAMES